VKTIALFALLLFLPLVAAGDVVDVDSGATGGFVDVTSTSAGVRVGPDAIRTAIRVRTQANAAVPVCFNYVDRTASCATGLTNPDAAGYCAYPGETYIYPVAEEHWRGQLCAILLSGPATVRVSYNAW
jgi:hypothetical protein